VSALGHRADLREVMAVSNLVLCLSKVPEAFGRTTLEALSLGPRDHDRVLARADGRRFGNPDATQLRGLLGRNG